MYCKEYEFNLWRDVNGEQRPVVWVELYADTVPSPLPTNAVGIDNFPKNYEPSKVIFAPGSALIVVNTGAVYLANNQGVFKAQ